MCHGDAGVIRSHGIRRTGRGSPLWPNGIAWGVFGDHAARSGVFVLFRAVVRLFQFSDGSAAAAQCLRRSCRTTAIRRCARAARVCATSTARHCSARDLCRCSSPAGASAGIGARCHRRLVQKLVCQFPPGVSGSAGAGSVGVAGLYARASIYPQLPLTNLFKGTSDPSQRPDPSGAGYPQQSLMGSQQRKSAATARVCSAPAEHLQPIGATLYAAGAARLRSSAGPAELRGTFGSAGLCSATRSAKLRGAAGSTSLQRARSRCRACRPV